MEERSCFEDVPQGDALFAHGAAQDCEARADKGLLEAVRKECQRLEDGIQAAIQLDPRTDCSREGGGFRVTRTTGGYQVFVDDLPSARRLESLAAWDGLEFIDDVAQSAPAAKWRSVNECFYGPLWSANERLMVMDAGWRRGSNAYVYGPSADTLTGGDWKVKYQGVQRKQLASFASQARKRGVRTYWRVSPSAPLEPSKAMDLLSDVDAQLLIDKCKDVLDLGFDGLLIAFDDITAQALAQSGMTGLDLVARQAEIINTVAGAVDVAPVIACPTHYWGAEDSPTRRRFGEVLNPAIPVVWTGPQVISLEMDAAQVRAVEREMNSPVWIWDNYPVNDWDGSALADLHSLPGAGVDNFVRPRHLPLAPVRGRGEAASAALAFGCNAAMGAHYSIPAIESSMDYAWLSGDYDARASWDTALSRSGCDPEDLRTIGNASGPHPGADDLAVPELAVACANVLTTFSSRRPGGGIPTLTDEESTALHELECSVAKHLAAVGNLRSAPNGLVREIWPWIEELVRQCELASLSARILGGKDPEGFGLRQISRLLSMPSQVSMAIEGAVPLAHYARSQIFGQAPDVPLT